MSLKELAKQITDSRYRKGFYTPSSIDYIEQRDLMLGKLMLIVTEVSEAAEAIRHNDRANFEEELADTFIRLFDICGAMDIDIDMAITTKMKINENRPVLHGKKTSI